MLAWAGLSLAAYWQVQEKWPGIVVGCRSPAVDTWVNGFRMAPQQGTVL